MKQIQLKKIFLTVVIVLSFQQCIKDRTNNRDPAGQNANLIGDPSVVSISPTNNFTGVFPDWKVVLTFSQKMEKTSIENAFSLVGSSTLTGAFSWNTEQTILTFQPTNVLTKGTTYIVTVTDTGISFTNRNIATFSSTFKVVNLSSSSTVNTLVVNVGHTSSPELTSLANFDGSDSIISWINYNTSSLVKQVWLQRLDDGGNPSWGNVQGLDTNGYIAKSGAVETSDPNIIYDSFGNLHLLFREQISNNILVGKLNLSNSLIQNPTEVFTTGAVSSTIAAGFKGNLAVSPTGWLSWLADVVTETKFSYKNDINFHTTLSASALPLTVTSGIVSTGIAWSGDASGQTFVNFFVHDNGLTAYKFINSTTDLSGKSNPWSTSGSLVSNSSITDASKVAWIESFQDSNNDIFLLWPFDNGSNIEIYALHLDVSPSSVGPTAKSGWTITTPSKVSNAVMGNTNIKTSVVRLSSGKFAIVVASNTIVKAGIVDLSSGPVQVGFQNIAIATAISEIKIIPDTIGGFYVAFIETTGTDTVKASHINLNNDFVTGFAANTPVTISNAVATGTGVDGKNNIQGSITVGGLVWFWEEKRTGVNTEIYMQFLSNTGDLFRSQSSVQ